MNGNILYDGKNWQDLSSDEKNRLASHVGMQFQRSALFDDLDVFDNVADLILGLKNEIEAVDREILSHLSEPWSSFVPELF